MKQPDRCQRLSDTSRLPIEPRTAQAALCGDTGQTACPFKQAEQVKAVVGMHNRAIDNFAEYQVGDLQSLLTVTRYNCNLRKMRDFDLL